MNVRAASLSPAEVERLTRRGLRLAQFTVVYNIAEGVLAVTFGLLAGLVSLVGFGADSGIEVAASVLVAIRLSARLQGMPVWVVDYVLVHELAHLLEPGHDAAFWGWVDRYPQAERAKGYLLGWSAAARLDPPPGDDVD